MITLREVTAETMWEICDLQVSEDQKQFVAPNDISLAQARSMIVPGTGQSMPMIPRWAL